MKSKFSHVRLKIAQLVKMPFMIVFRRLTSLIFKGQTANHLDMVYP